MAIFANMPHITTSVPKESMKALKFEEFKKEVLSDYKTAWISRQASLIGRKEVLTGKAKFGIFGDGKEIPQLAMARAFTAGDIRSGYYRDQTFMLAKGLTSIRQFFAQLYAHPSLESEPASGGRLMNGHFSTRFLDEHGNWRALSEELHSTSDISPTAGQMGRALGIAYASKLYRNNPASPIRLPLVEQVEKLVLLPSATHRHQRAIFGKHSMPLQSFKFRCSSAFGMMNMVFQCQRAIRRQKRTSAAFCRVSKPNRVDEASNYTPCVVGITHHSALPTRRRCKKCAKTTCPWFSTSPNSPNHRDIRLPDLTSVINRLSALIGNANTTVWSKCVHGY